MAESVALGIQTTSAQGAQRARTDQPGLGLGAEALRALLRPLQSEAPPVATPTADGGFSIAVGEHLSIRQSAAGELTIGRANGPRVPFSDAVKMLPSSERAITERAVAGALKSAGREQAAAGGRDRLRALTETDYLARPTEPAMPGAAVGGAAVDAAVGGPTTDGADTRSPQRRAIDCATDDLLFSQRTRALGLAGDKPVLTTQSGAAFILRENQVVMAGAGLEHGLNLTALAKSDDAARGLEALVRQDLSKAKLGPIEQIRNPSLLQRLFGVPLGAEVELPDGESKRAIRSIKL